MRSQPMAQDNLDSKSIPLTPRLSWEPLFLKPTEWERRQQFYSTGYVRGRRRVDNCQGMIENHEIVLGWCWWNLSNDIMNVDFHPFALSSCTFPVSLLFFYCFFFLALQSIRLQSCCNPTSPPYRAEWGCCNQHFRQLFTRKCQQI